MIKAHFSFLRCSVKVLYYSSLKARACKKVVETILTVIHRDSLKIYRTLRTLSERLLEPMGDLSVAVLCISSQEEFSSLLTIKDLLKDMRIILILPDREKTTISKGHRLGARFLSYKDSDFSDLAAVLHHIVEKLDMEHLNINNHYDSLQNLSRE